MSKLAHHGAAVSALILSIVASASGAMIDFRPALIPVGLPPQPVPLAIATVAPTAADTISFTAPLDGEVHSNSCYAARALRGRPVLEIDEANHVINIRFDGIFSDICLEIYDPIVGVYGEFGPLAPGDWAFHNTHDNSSLDFTVAPATVPEPASGMLLCACAAGLVTRRRRGRR